MKRPKQSMLTPVKRKCSKLHVYISVIMSPYVILETTVLSSFLIRCKREKWFLFIIDSQYSGHISYRQINTRALANN